jgi:hypothetical protein
MRLLRTTHNTVKWVFAGIDAVPISKARCVIEQSKTAFNALRCTVKVSQRLRLIARKDAGGSIIGSSGES